MSPVLRLVTSAVIISVAIGCCFVEPALDASELVRKMHQEKTEHERLSGEIPDIYGRILWILKAAGVVLFIFAVWLFAGLF